MPSISLRLVSNYFFDRIIRDSAETVRLRGCHELKCMAGGDGGLENKVYRTAREDGNDSLGRQPGRERFKTGLSIPNTRVPIRNGSPDLDVCVTSSAKGLHISYVGKLGGHRLIKRSGQQKLGVGNCMIRRRKTGSLPFFFFFLFSFCIFFSFCLPICLSSLLHSLMFSYSVFFRATIYCFWVG